LYKVNHLTPYWSHSLPSESKISYEVETRDMEMKKLHEHIKAHIEKVYEAYKAKVNKSIKGIEF